MTILAEIIQNESDSIQFYILKSNYYKVNRLKANRLQNEAFHLHINEEYNRLEYDHQNESITI